MPRQLGSAGYVGAMENRIAIAIVAAGGMPPVAYSAPQSCVPEPFIQEAYVKSSESAQNHLFGNSIDASGNSVIVGEPLNGIAAGAG